jgi:hypothetical protein
MGKLRYFAAYNAPIRRIVLRLLSTKFSLKIWPV